MINTASAEAGISTIEPTPESALAIIPSTPPTNMYGNPKRRVRSAEPKIWNESPGSIPALNRQSKVKNKILAAQALVSAKCLR
jgi:hypothetical protein